MSLQLSEKIDIANIVLMLFACAVAVYIPFELFLFSYAVLGPLHYLTEISWLHDRKYYTKERYDASILFIAGVALTLFFFQKDIELEFPQHFDANIIYIAFLSSLIFVTVKNKFHKIAGIVLLILTSQISHHFVLFFTMFLPTLVHVYVFTALFMLYGALKSGSKYGMLSVAVLMLCPLLLYTAFPDEISRPPIYYSRNAMGIFKNMNIAWLTRVSGYSQQSSLDKWDDLIFSSRAGILFMRFVAFAYTYHYLNWFSKTRIIQWHKVPKWRFVGVIIFWLLSIALYAYNYGAGLQWLFFLSFLHVLLELPLNFTSIVGIGKHFQTKIFRPGIYKA